MKHYNTDKSQNPLQVHIFSVSSPPIGLSMQNKNHNDSTVGYLALWILGKLSFFCSSGLIIEGEGAHSPAGARI